MENEPEKCLTLEEKEKIKERLALLKKEYRRTVSRLQRSQRAERVKTHVKKTIEEQNRLLSQEVPETDGDPVSSGPVASISKAPGEDGASQQISEPPVPTQERKPSVTFKLEPEVVHPGSGTPPCSGGESSGQEASGASYSNPVSRSRLRLRRSTKRVCFSESPSPNVFSLGGLINVPDGQEKGNLDGSLSPVFKKQPADELAIKANNTYCSESAKPEIIGLSGNELLRLGTVDNSPGCVKRKDNTLQSEADPKYQPNSLASEGQALVTDISAGCQARETKKLGNKEDQQLNIKVTPTGQGGEPDRFDTRVEPALLTGVTPTNRGGDNCLDRELKKLAYNEEQQLRIKVSPTGQVGEPKKFGNQEEQRLDIKVIPTGQVGEPNRFDTTVEPTLLTGVTPTNRGGDPCLYREPKKLANRDEQKLHIKVTPRNREELHLDIKVTPTGQVVEPNRFDTTEDKTLLTGVTPNIRRGDPCLYREPQKFGNREQLHLDIKVIPVGQVGEPNRFDIIGEPQNSANREEQKTGKKVTPTRQGGDPCLYRRPQKFGHTEDQQPDTKVTPTGQLGEPHKFDTKVESTLLRGVTPTNQGGGKKLPNRKEEQPDLKVTPTGKGGEPTLLTIVTSTNQTGDLHSFGGPQDTSDVRPLFKPPGMERHNSTCVTPIGALQTENHSNIKPTSTKSSPSNSPLSNDTRPVPSHVLKEEDHNPLSSCTLIEGLLFPVEYYVRTTRRMTSCQRKVDLDAVISSHLGTARKGRRPRRNSTSLSTPQSLDDGSLTPLSRHSSVKKGSTRSRQGRGRKSCPALLSGLNDVSVQLQFGAEDCLTPSSSQSEKENCDETSKEVQSNIKTFTDCSETDLKTPSPISQGDPCFRFFPTSHDATGKLGDLQNLGDDSGSPVSSFPRLDSRLNVALQSGCFTDFHLPDEDFGLLKLEKLKSANLLEVFTPHTPKQGVKSRQSKQLCSIGSSTATSTGGSAVLQETEKAAYPSTSKSKMNKQHIEDNKPRIMELENRRSAKVLEGFTSHTPKQDSKFGQPGDNEGTTVTSTDGAAALHDTEKATSSPSSRSDLNILKMNHKCIKYDQPRPEELKRTRKANFPEGFIPHAHKQGTKPCKNESVTVTSTGGEAALHEIEKAAITPSSKSDVNILKINQKCIKYDQPMPEELKKTRPANFLQGFTPRTPKPGIESRQTCKNESIFTGGAAEKKADCLESDLSVLEINKDSQKVNDAAQNQEEHLGNSQELIGDPPDPSSLNREPTCASPLQPSSGKRNLNYSDKTNLLNPNNQILSGLCPGQSVPNTELYIPNNATSPTHYDVWGGPASEELIDAPANLGMESLIKSPIIPKTQQRVREANASVLFSTSLCSVPLESLNDGVALTSTPGFPYLGATPAIFSTPRHLTQSPTEEEREKISTKEHEKRLEVEEQEKRSEEEREKSSTKKQEKRSSKDVQEKRSTEEVQEKRSAEEVLEKTPPLKIFKEGGGRMTSQRREAASGDEEDTWLSIASQNCNNGLLGKLEDSMEDGEKQNKEAKEYDRDERISERRKRNNDEDLEGEEGGHLHLVSEIRDSCSGGGCAVDLCSVWWEFSGCTELCVVSASESTICLWRPQMKGTWQCVHTWSFMEMPVIQILPLAQEKNILCVALGNLEISEIWAVFSSPEGDCPGKQLVKSGHTKSTQGLSRLRLASSGRVRGGQLVEVHQLSELGSTVESHSLMSPRDSVLAFCELQGERDALIGSTMDNYVVVWNMVTGHLLSAIYLGDLCSNLVCLSASSDSGILFLVAGSLFSSQCKEEGSCVFRLIAANPRGGSSALVMSYVIPDRPDSRYLEGDVSLHSVAAVLTCGSIALWDLRSSHCSATLPPGTGAPWCLARWGHPPSCLLTGQKDGTICIFEYKNKTAT